MDDLGGANGEGWQTPTVAEVDLGAIRHNVAVLRERVGVPLMAVVKSNAYGHGAVPVARAALDAGASRLAVATVEEGIELRTAGITAPILVLGWSPPFLIEPALRHDLALGVFDDASLEAIATVARRIAVRARVHVKVDTGMGRLGLPAWDGSALRAFAERLRRPEVQVEGIFTHLACADEDDPNETYQQLARFDEALAVLRPAAGSGCLIHAANSAAAIRFPEARRDLVRIGIALYGLAPFPAADRLVGLRPALSWRTRVAQVKVLAPGIGISYGRTYVAERPLRVAILPVGYADGYDRLLSNRGQVLVGGRRARVLGRVCMNLTIVGEVDESVRPGDEVVLLGRQGSAAVTADEIAGWLNTITYEVVTRISERVPRHYVDQGAEPCPVPGHALAD